MKIEWTPAALNAALEAWETMPVPEKWSNEDQMRAALDAAVEAQGPDTLLSRGDAAYLKTRLRIEREEAWRKARADALEEARQMVAEVEAQGGFDESSLRPIEQFPGYVDHLRAKCDALAEDGKRLKEALEPFAKVLAGNYSEQPDTMPIRAGFNQFDLRFELKLGYLRRARAALEQNTESE